MPRRFVRSSLALLLLGLAACQTRSERPASSPDAVTAPTPQELANATYVGLEMVPDTVTLTDGEWEGPDEGVPMRAHITLINTPPLVADLTHDGQPDAVATLQVSGGGTGSWTNFVVMSRGAQGLVTAATTELPDRSQIRSLRLEGDTLVADVVESGMNAAGESDPACCPGDLATYRWRMVDGKFERVAHTRTGRLSSAALMGTSWTLTEWDRDQPAPADPAVQLAFTTDGVNGQAGCNSFRGAFQGDDVSTLTFGPLATTRKLCPPPQMEVETRFLKALAGVQSFSFTAGKLTLATQTANGMAWMTFTAAADTTH